MDTKHVSVDVMVHEMFRILQEDFGEVRNTSLKAHHGPLDFFRFIFYNCLCTFQPANGRSIAHSHVKICFSFLQFFLFLEMQRCHSFAEGFKKAIGENGKLGPKYANVPYAITK